MESLVALTVSKWSVKPDDDFVDRLSHRYTCVILVIFATIISTKQYVGDPITCWVPAEFHGSHTKFTNSYCWVKNTYYLPYEEEIPKEQEHEKRHMIVYYQWIPFIFLLQALLFYMPTVIWHGLNSKAGIDSDNILDTANKIQLTDKVEAKVNLLGLLVNQMHRFLRSRKDRVAKWKLNMKSCINTLFCGCCGKRMGSYLIVLFVISKLFYALNVIGQLLLLSKVFQTDYSSFGLDFFTKPDDLPENNPTFPRTTMCDLKIRRLGNNHRYTVQCVLPINLYMELMYVFLWFWMILVAIATFLSLFIWITRFILRSDRRRFLSNHLVVMDRAQDEKETLVDVFLDDYLQQDGAFLLRLISHNTNHIISTEITCALWDHWLEKRSPSEENTLESTYGSLTGGDTLGGDTLDLKCRSPPGGDTMVMKPMSAPPPAYAEKNVYSIS